MANGTNPKILVVAGIKKVETKALMQKELNEIAKGLTFNIGGSGSSGANGLTAQISSTNRELVSMRTNTRNAGRDARTLGNTIADVSKKFGLWLSVASAYRASLRVFRDGVERIKEFDDAMLELNKVTNETDATMSAFVKTANEAGVSLGRTSTEVVNATAQFARAGFELKDALSLGEQALLLTNIGDGIKDVGVASDSIIAVLKGFRLEASETAHVIDALNEVSNNYAVTTSDLTKGLQRSSAVLAQTGTTLEQTIALITSGTEVLRNPEKVANGLNTISTRLRGLNEEGESLGETFTPKLQEAFKTLAGVDIMENGELRSTFEILTDTAKVWDTLGSSTQSYLAELASGKRQMQLFNALMTNSGTITDATTTALNSQGSALAENEKYLDSISGRLGIFSGELTKLWTNTINSETIKTVIDMGTAFIKLADAIGLLNIALITMVSAGFAKFSIYIPAVSTAMTTLAGATAGLISVMSGALVGIAIVGAIKAFDLLITTTEEYDEKIISLTTNLDSLKLQRDELNKANEEGIAIDQNQLLILNKRIEAEEKLLAIQQKKRAKQVVEGDIFNQSGIDKIKVLSDNLNDARANFERLKNQGGATAQQLDNLNKIVLENEIALGNQISAMKESLQYYDQTDIGLLDVVNSAEELLGIQDEGMARWKKYNDYVKKGSEVLDRAVVETKDYKEELETLNNIGTDFSATLSTINDGQQISAEVILDLINKYPQLTDKILMLNNTELDRKAILESIFETQKQQTINELENARDKLIATVNLNREYVKQLEILGELSGEDINPYYKMLAESLEASKAVKELGARISVLKNATIDTFSQSVIKDYAKDMKKADDEAKKLAEELKKMQLDILEGIIDSLEEQNDLWEEQADSILKGVTDELEKQKDIITEQHNAVIDAINDELDVMAEKKRVQDATNEALDDEKKLREKLIEIEEAKRRRDDILANKDTAVFRKGKGFVYEANPSALREINKEIVDLEKEKDDIILDNKRNAENRAYEDRRAQYQRDIQAENERYAESIKTIDNALSEMSRITGMELSMQNSYWDEFVKNSAGSISAFVSNISMAISAIQSLNSQQIGGQGAISQAQSRINAISGTAPNTGFGTKGSQSSADYYANLKSATGGNQALMVQAEIARANQVIAERIKQGMDTKSQEAYLSKLQSGKVTFHDGGEVGTNKSFADLFNLRSDERIIKAQVGEGIIPANIMTALTNGMNSAVPSMGAMGSSGSEINIANLTVQANDANDFINSMKQLSQRVSLGK